jgi:hypothetical protein
MQEFVSVSTQRAMNLRRVLHEVLSAGSDEALTRAAIASRVQITRATATRLSDQLVSLGLLQELPPIMTGGPGRPGRVLVGNNNLVSLGVDIGVSCIRMMGLGLGGDELFRKQFELDVPALSSEEVFSLVGNELNLFVSNLSSRAVIFAVTVSVPGLVDSDNRKVVYAPNLGWSHVDVCQQIRSSIQFPVKSIEVHNEANMAAWTQAWKHPGCPSGLDTFAYISGGIGVGAAVVENRQLYQGRHGWVGEIGHLTIDPHGIQCKCGAQGCLERYVGREALEARRGNEAALVESARALGLALAALTNILDVSLIIIGGDLTNFFTEYKTEVTRLMHLHTIADEQRFLQTTSSTCEMPAVRGAAIRGFRALLDAPTELGKFAR